MQNIRQSGTGIISRTMVPSDSNYTISFGFLQICGGGYETIGIISAGSAAYAVGPRDQYFGITKENRSVALNSIVDNTVFRLERNIPNLGTQILKAWRNKVQEDWFQKYGVHVAGFETFVIENDRRKGSLYKADNWTFVGETSGNAKVHLHGIKNSFERKNVCKKLIFCKWVRDGQLATEYFSNWSNSKQIRGQMSLFDIMEERK